MTNSNMALFAAWATGYAVGVLIALILLSSHKKEHHGQTTENRD